MPDPLEIPEFLKIPQADRKAAWDKHRTAARPISSAISAEEQWREDRDRMYDEATRKDDTGV